MKSTDRLAFWKILLGCVLLLAATILVYSPVWQGQFLWDDEFLVQKNPFIRSPLLAMEVFRHFLFTDAKGEFYRPVQNLSYMIDYWRAGLDASAFHWTNILIHGVNGCLLFFLAGDLFRKIGNLTRAKSVWLAFCVTAFWLLHPVHSAIVAYVSGRADSLALAGVLSAWLCWENASTSPKKTRAVAGYLLAIVLVLAGCCSKEIATAGLGLFLFYLWLIRVDLPGSLRGKTTLGLLVIFGCYLALRQLPDSNIAPPGVEVISWSEKMELFSRAMGDYARLFIYPEKLFMERQVGISTGLFTDPVKNDPLFPYLGWVGCVALVLLAISIFWQGGGRRLRLLGSLWFGVMILPVSNLISLNASVAEHWLYIPSIGLCLWVVGCWLDCGKKIQRVSSVIFPILLVLLGIRAYERVADWKDALTFYRATIRDGGDSVRVRINLAAEYQKAGKLVEAERIYRSILRAIPNFPLAKISLAQNLKLQKRKPEADEIMRESGKNNQAGMTERVAVLDMLRQSKHYSEATKIARLAYETSPNSWPLASALGKIYAEQNQPKVALELVKGFAARNWWHAESHNTLGELYVSTGQPDQAVAAYLAAADLDIRDAEPLNQAAVLLAQSGKYTEATDVQERAISRNGTARQVEILALIQKMAAENHSSR